MLTVKGWFDVLNKQNEGDKIVPICAVSRGICNDAERVVFLLTICHIAFSTRVPNSGGKPPCLG